MSLRIPYLVGTPPTTKVCNNPYCEHGGAEQPLENYYKEKQSRDGHAHRCKDCAKATARRWRLEHPDEARAHVREFHRQHGPEIRARKKARALEKKAVENAGAGW